MSEPFCPAIWDDHIRNWALPGTPDNVKDQWKTLASKGEAVSDDPQIGRQILGLLAEVAAPRNRKPKPECSGEEFALIERIIEKARTNVCWAIDTYLCLRPDDESERQKVQAAVARVLDEISDGTTNFSFQDDEVAQRLLQNLCEAFGTEALAFWEDVEGKENVSANNFKVVPVEEPTTKRKFVTKLKDTLVKDYTDPRILVLFQEAARHYGLKTVEEVTVLPTREFFRNKERQRWLQYMKSGTSYICYPEYMRKADKYHEEKGKRGLRVAKRLKSFAVPKDNRKSMAEEEREWLEQWFPEDIFNDKQARKYRVVIRGFEDSERTIVSRGTYFSPGKFQKWHKNLGENDRAKFRRSIEPLYNMVRDGFFVDLFGGRNFAIRDCEFILIDVEPLALSNIPQGRYCVRHSQIFMNAMFRAAGFPEVDFEETIKDVYGPDKFLKKVKDIEPCIHSERGMTWKGGEVYTTNVTHGEELARYQTRINELNLEKGEPTIEENFPSDLVEQNRILVKMALDPNCETFKGQQYFWTNRSAASYTNRTLF